jgi:putative membrane protein
MELRPVIALRVGAVLRVAGIALPRIQSAWIVATGAAALLSLIGGPYPGLAPLQNLPTLAVLGLLVLALRKWPLPTSAVGCFCTFLLLHTLAGRYIYSYVPYDQWFAAVGMPTPTEVFGFRRNHFDRVIHFSFGLLMVHPIARILSLHLGVRQHLTGYVAVLLVLAGSAVYEIFEWLLTVVMAGPDADAYNGQQGDSWDAQKDMALAGMGAAIAAVWEWRNSKTFLYLRH